MRACRLKHLKGDKLRRHVALAFKHGPAYFINRGYTLEEYHDFIDLPPVRFHMAMLLAQYSVHEQEESKVRFDLRRNLGELANSAVKVMKRAIEGPKYEYTEIGTGANRRRVVKYEKQGKLVAPVMLAPGPSRLQLKAVEMLFDSLGVVPEDNKVLAQIDPPEKKFVHSQSEVEQSRVAQLASGMGSGTAGEKAISRERVRAVFARVVSTNGQQKQIEDASAKKAG